MNYLEIPSTWQGKELSLRCTLLSLLVCYNYTVIEWNIKMNRHLCYLKVSEPAVEFALTRWANIVTMLPSLYWLWLHLLRRSRRPSFAFGKKLASYLQKSIQASLRLPRPVMHTSVSYLLTMAVLQGNYLETQTYLWYPVATTNLLSCFPYPCLFVFLIVPNNFPAIWKTSGLCLLQGGFNLLIGQYPVCLWISFVRRRHLRSWQQIILYTPGYRFR